MKHSTESWEDFLRNKNTLLSFSPVQFKSIKLTKEAINPENPASVDDDTVEMLEDVISTAIMDASNKAQTQMESKMKAVTGGIKIPGLF